MRSGRLRATGASPVIAVAALVLAACAGPVPRAEPEAVPAVAPPAMSVAQSGEVLSEIGSVLAAGDAALNATGLEARLTGPALAVRAWEYARAATVGKPLTVLPMAAQVVVVPNTATWPRTQLVVTEQPDTLGAPRILVLQQASAREPYRLWGWARLGQGVQMPATADPVLGSVVVPLDSTDLLVPPGEVLARYADVLANGDLSAFAPSFAPDFFRPGIEAERAKYQASVNGVGSVTETYAPMPDPPVALATADGGAIVVGSLGTTTTLAVAQGSLNLDPTDAALTGRASVTSNIVYTWADVLAFYVPPAGSAAPVRLLAGEHARTTVTGS